MQVHLRKFIVLGLKFLLWKYYTCSFPQKDFNDIFNTLIKFSLLKFVKETRLAISHLFNAALPWLGNFSSYLNYYFELRLMSLNTDPADIY